MDIFVTNYPLLIAFWLVFTKILTIVFQIPLLDNQSVPVQLKVLFSLILSYAFYPIVQGAVYQQVMHYGVHNFWALTIFYAVTGLMIGYLVKSIMTLFISTGSMITQQIGFSSVSYFDPNFVSQIGPIEKLIQWTLVIMILSSGALLPIFQAILSTLQNSATVMLSSGDNMTEFFLRFFKGAFSASLTLAMPVLFTNLMLNLIMGIVARTIPQMNILMVSFVVSIGVGLFVFFATSEEFFASSYTIYVERLGEWFQFVK